jgi:hypothetical protein
MPNARARPPNGAPTRSERKQKRFTRLARRLALSCYRFVVVHLEDRSIRDASLYELKEATVVGAADLPPHTAASVYDVEQLPVARAVVLPYLPEAARPMPVRIRVPYIHAAA